MTEVVLFGAYHLKN